MTSRPVSAELKAAIAFAYRDGQRIKAICDELHVERHTVYHALRVHGVPLDPARYRRSASFDEQAVIARYTSTQMTCAAIEREFGLRPSMVSRCLRRHRIPVEQRRVYTSKVDWAEARRLHSTGLSAAEVGRRMGVAHRTVLLAINRSVTGGPDETRWSGESQCVDCGAKINVSSSRCVPCNAKLSVKRDDQGRLYCAKCDKWKDPEEFTPNSTPGRGRAPRCRQCETAARRAWRAANRERDNATNRASKRRRREKAA